jgi:predicted nucleic acid-binding protein
VILADTSAWVEFLRGTGSQANVRLRELLDRDAIATTDVVLMELLAGARDDHHRDALRGLLARCEFTPTDGPSDYEAAAELYRACRRAGHTVRALTDCLIASVAIRSGAALLHADADFDTLARYTPLETA